MPVHQFPTRDAARASGKSPTEWHLEGPIHRHQGKLFVQVYLGQHEWLAISVDDPQVAFRDQGWEGTEFGWGVVDKADFPKAYPDEEIDLPDREGQPVRHDDILFADKDKLIAYLGPEDPISKSFLKG